MSQIVVAQRMWQRRDTSANWTSKNPVLNAGEIGVDISYIPPRMKVGDGVRAWNSLGFAIGEQPFAIATGTADALVANFDPAISSLTDGQQILVRAAAANAASAPTLKVNAMTARAITKNGNAILDAGDIRGAGHELLLRYVAATTPRFELLNPASSGGGGSVSSIVAGAGIDVDSSDPAHPVVSASSSSATHVVPLASDFPTYLGASPAITVTDKVGRMAIRVPSAQTRPRCLLKSLPSVPYTIDLGASIIGLDPASDDAYAFSIGLSDGTKICSYSFAVFSSGVRVSCDHWNSTTSYSSNAFTTGIFAPTPREVYLRLTDDGTTRKLYLSLNGKDFLLVYSEANTAFLTATLGGIEVYNYSNTGFDSLVTVTHFKISNSVLGDAA